MATKANKLDKKLLNHNRKIGEENQEFKVSLSLLSKKSFNLKKKSGKENYVRDEMSGLQISQLR